MSASIAVHLDSWDVRAAAKPRLRWGLLPWIVVVSVVGLLCLLLVSVMSKWAQAPALANGHDVVMAMKIFANDNCSVYPDRIVVPENMANQPTLEGGSAKSTPTGRVTAQASNANEAFRNLFTEEIVAEEKIFGCPHSPFVPDGDTGAAPKFEQALTDGENHWAMVFGQTTSNSGTTPIIFENALDASWPPRWRGDGLENAKGRVWPGGKVLMFFNDNSARFVALTKAADGNLTLPEDFIPSLHLGGDPLQVLDIAERK